MLFSVFIALVCLLCATVGWFLHKIYLRSVVYRPLRFTARNIRRQRFKARRAPRRPQLKALRKISRQTSLIKKADRFLDLDSLLGDSIF